MQVETTRPRYDFAGSVVGLSAGLAASCLRSSEMAAGRGFRRVQIERQVFAGDLSQPVQGGCTNLRVGVVEAVHQKFSIAAQAVRIFGRQLCKRRHCAVDHEILLRRQCQAIQVKQNRGPLHAHGFQFGQAPYPGRGSPRH